MTKLSVNINKIALLRNARGHDFPNVETFSRRCLELGAHGITLHPRPDQRHARYEDVHRLMGVCRAAGKELNVEGFPSAEFLDVVLKARPDQCTLVPDEPGQLTSDHGWEVAKHRDLLEGVLAKLNRANIRASLFLDAGSSEAPLARDVGADRIELYTEPYANDYGTRGESRSLAAFAETARNAQSSGLGVNAGHDLSLRNLRTFLTIPNILEVSIGHALVVECLEQGVERVLASYLEILAAAR